MQIVRWLFLSVGAALSILLSHGFVTRTVVVGSREGRWVPYIHVFEWRSIVVWAVSLRGCCCCFASLSPLSRDREWLWLFIWIAAALLVEGLICSLAPFRFDRIFVSDGANSFYSVAARYTPSTMLGDFEAARKDWPLHAYANMPGKLVLVYWLRQISGNPTAMAWMVVAISNLGAVFLYGLARDLFDRRTAAYALLLYIVTPGKMFFFPLLNTVTPVWTLLASWLFVRWLRSHNPLYVVLFGATIYAIILFEPSALAIGGLLLGLIVWSLSRSVIHPVTFLWQGALGFVAFGATYAAVYSIYGFDLRSAVRLLADYAAKFNIDTHRSYDAWVRGNLVEFLVAVGVCQAVLSLGAVVDGLMTPSEPLRSRFTSPPVVVTMALAGSLLVTDVLGINRGEVVRLWIYLACACQLPAAYLCARFTGRLAFGIVLALSLLHDALGTAMIGFILPG